MEGISRLLGSGSQLQGTTPSFLFKSCMLMMSQVKVMMGHGVTAE